MRVLAAYSVLGLFLLACGGSEPAVQAPDAEAEMEPAEAAPAPAPAPPPAEAAEEPKTEPKPEPAPAPEPEFTEGMSVEQAIKAVPIGAERANIDQETLGKPLQEFSVYEPCKPGNAHFKLKIAVWDGKVVGADVTSTPKNPKLEACIKEQLKTLTWQAKVKSLNVVEYAF